MVTANPGQMSAPFRLQRLNRSAEKLTNESVGSFLWISAPPWLLVEDPKRATLSGFTIQDSPATAAYHTLQALSRTMGVPFLQPKACQNSGIFDNTLFTRYLG